MRAILGALSLSGTAHAWVNETGTCIGASDSYWQPGSKGVSLCNLNPWPTFPNAAPPSLERAPVVMNKTLMHSFTAWNMYSAQNFHLFLDTSQYNQCTDDWFDSGDEQNTMWWKPSISDDCDSDTAIGCVAV
jgi:hypothetical protein